MVSCFALSTFPRAQRDEPADVTFHEKNQKIHTGQKGVLRNLSRASPTQKLNKVV